MYHIIKCDHVYISFMTLYIVPSTSHDQERNAMIYRKSKDMYIVHVYLSHSHIREFNASHVFVTTNHCPQTKNILNLC